MALLGVSPAHADDEAATASRLNKEALSAFDNLNFDQAKTLLEQALSACEAGGLTKDPVTARTHLNLGMLLIAGFQQRDQAVEHFKAALKIDPDITAPPGLFNPEVQTAFDEVKTNLKNEPPPPKPASKPARTAPSTTRAAAENESGGEEEEDETSSIGGSGVVLSLGVGSGFGTAKGHLDANKDILQNNMPDNSWSGGVAPSRLGHIGLGIGYFLSPDLMLSVEGRFQIITGTTATPMTAHCMPSCKPPTMAIAGFAKASWFFLPAPARPFVTAGIGGGTIRQVVALAGDAHDCGDGKQRCVDTVTGGPLLLAAGGGILYELGTSVALLGSATANVGVPKFMLNLDVLLGVALRL
jgi:hypothetical protein